MTLHDRNDLPENPRVTAQRRSGLAGARLAAAIILTAGLGLHTAAVLCISFGVQLIPEGTPFANEFPYLGALLTGFLILLNLDVYLRGIRQLLRSAPDMDSLISVSTLGGFAYSLFVLMSQTASAHSLSFFPVVGFTLALTDLGLYAEARAEFDMLQAQTTSVKAVSDSTTKKNQSSSEKGFHFEPPSDAAPDKHADKPVEKQVPTEDAPKESKIPQPEETLPPASTVTGMAAVVAVLLALAGALVLYFLGAPVSDVLAVASGILIIACPGAIALCRTLPQCIAANTILSSGIRINSQDAIRKASEINTLVIGRSILLDRKKIHITDFLAEGLTDATFFSLAATAEADSYHPIALAINDRALRLHARMLRSSARTEVPGCGVEALAGGASLRVGRGDWIQKQGVRISAELQTRADQLESKGKTVVFVSSNQFAKGLIAFANEPQPEVKKMIKKLQSAGIEPVLMTSDSARTAKALAQELGITEYKAACHHNERAKEIQLLQAQGKNVALLDTLKHENDAAAAQSDYVIAPGGTSAEAAKSAQITLSHPGLAPLAPFFTLGRKVEKLTRQNYIWAAIGTILALPVASGIAYSFGGPVLSPPIALLASIPGFFACLINALRLIYD